MEQNWHTLERKKSHLYLGKRTRGTTVFLFPTIENAGGIQCFGCAYVYAYIGFLVKVLIETNVNISNELHFSDVYRRVNYIGLLAKFT